MISGRPPVTGKRRVKRKQRILRKGQVTYLLVYLFVIFFPLVLIIASQVSTAQLIDSSLLGGFITGSGIFAGFLTASAISRREALEPHHYLLLLTNLGLFFVVLNVIFIKHVFSVGRPDLLDFGLVMVAVNANAFTAIIIALRLLVQETFGPLFQALIKAFETTKKEKPPPPPPPS